MTNPSAEHYDLIVVGGGPAGATAALYARRHGLNTLLLDKARFPRDKICGDALSGKSVTILHDLGLLDQVRNLPGAAISRIVFGSPDHTQADIDLSLHDHRDLLTGQLMPMEGFVIRRQIFDRFLFEQARQAADRCLEGFAVRDLVIEEGQVRGVSGRHENSGDEQVFHGDIVLGCDGFNSMVARKSGLYQHDSAHWMVAVRCYYEGVAGLTDQIELHFVDPVLPGYFWIFPLQNGTANIGVGMPHDAIRQRGVKLREVLDQSIDSPAFRQRFAGARRLEEPVGWNLPVGSKRRRMHGDGLLLLGDAAGLIDPFTGEGIGNALYSGRLAVETAVEARQARDFSAGFLQTYEQRVWTALGDELKISTNMQRLGRWSPLLNLVVRRAARNPAIRELLSGMMANAVPKKQLTNPLFYLKLLVRN